ncbi:MAG: long-chain fatty acid--CoA ligase [Acidobacteriales bacterium]|nr:long-chain fatty acid--CoA ligase [Terriglobales bacterium]
MSTPSRLIPLETLCDVFFVAISRELPRAMSYKKDAHWVDISTRELYSRVVTVARALESWGIAKGDRVAILAENRPEWVFADFACLLLGVVDVPIYPTLTADQIAYMLNDSGARIVFVSTQEQLSKVLSICGKTALEKVVVMDDVGAGASKVISMSALLATPKQGRDTELEARARTIDPNDLATILYTSGTTGTPKGVMLTHGNIAANVMYSLAPFPIGIGEIYISFLPLCHIFARHVDYTMFVHGLTLAYCPRLENLPQTFLEVRPTFEITVPRVLEKAQQKVSERASKGVKRWIANWAMSVGRKHIPDVVEGRRPRSLAWRLADVLMFSKIRAGFGGRIHYFISGGAPLGLALAEWCAAAGILVYEGYGLTETSPVIAVNTPEHHKLGTVGRPLPNVECKVAEDGELLVRGPSVFNGYWNLPEETKAAFEDGWFKTGDIASIDSDGFISILDRKKDLIKTSAGKFIAPQPLENTLKMNALVSHAAVLGDRRNFPAVLIAPNFVLLEEWARNNSIGFASRTELVAHPKVQALYEDAVEQINAGLAQYEKLKRVLLVADEFSIQTGELTPSMKLKRRTVEQKYKSQIDAMYAGAAAEYSTAGR